MGFFSPKSFLGLTSLKNGTLTLATLGCILHFMAFTRITIHEPAVSIIIHLICIACFVCGIFGAYKEKSGLALVYAIFNIIYSVLIAFAALISLIAINMFGGYIDGDVSEILARYSIIIFIIFLVMFIINLYFTCVSIAFRKELKEKEAKQADVAYAVAKV